MSSIIQLLPDHVANQIAAGEVVQRPASIVKELLENAVDAGATDIKLLVKEAGKTLVQIIDNGKGMNVTDARLCFERHATSKIRQAEDLFSLHTKGFRGEALASIAAIAHVDLKTKQDQDELGTQIIIEGSKFISQEVVVVPKGTSFAIKNLFFNIPARRNFLKSDTIEFRHIVDEFQRLVLAHPQIHFTFFHNGSEMYNLPKASVKQRIISVFGGKTAEKLVPVTEKTEMVQVSGFVCKPEFAKKTRGEQFFFVNDRFIKSPYLHHAVLAAYDGILKDGNQPSYFLFLTVPPHTIDINIHPTKTEIKFDDESALYAILRATIKHSLGQFNIAPVLDFERDATLDTPYHFKNMEGVVPTVAFNDSFNPFAKVAPKQSVYSHKTSAPSWESMYVGLQNDFFDSSKNTAHTIEAEDMVTPSLFNENDVEKSVQKAYQIDKKYIVSPIKSGIVIIHQNRAHQRILYEQILINLTHTTAASQQLLFPLDVFFSNLELSLLQELQPTLVTMGFVFDTQINTHLVVKGIPVAVSESEVSFILEQLVADLQNGITTSSFSQNDVIAKSIAKSAAVKVGVSLSEKEQENLVNGLFACKEPSISPYNKPIFITLRTEDIDKKFAL